MNRVIDWPRYSRWTWIVAALLLLFLLWRWFSGHGPGADCCAAPEVAPVAAPAPVATEPEPAAATAPAAATPGTLGFVYEDGKWVPTGTVPDQATRDRLFASAETAFGKGNVVDRLTIDAAAAASICAAKPDDLVTWLKGSGSVGIECAGNTVTVSGTVPSERTKQEYGTWAQDFFGPDATIVNNLRVLQAASTAEDVRCGDSIGAAVTFETASAQIDAAGRKLLDAVAECLKEGSYEIGGHTDNTGTDRINDPLSQRRAEAVRDYLVGKGVDAARLTARGYGSKRPIASNDTDAGKAQNRRIEFHKQ